MTADKEKEGATETTPGGDAGGAKKAAVEDSAAAAKEKEEEKMSVGGVTLEELLHRLPNCVNRDLIDKAAIDFCYINTKGNRKKLIKVRLLLRALLTPSPQPRANDLTTNVVHTTLLPPRHCSTRPGLSLPCFRTMPVSWPRSTSA